MPPSKKHSTDDDGNGNDDNNVLAAFLHAKKGREKMMMVTRTIPTLSKMVTNKNGSGSFICIAAVAVSFPSFSHISSLFWGSGLGWRV